MDNYIPFVHYVLVDFVWKDATSFVPVLLRAALQPGLGND